MILTPHFYKTLDPIEYNLLPHAEPSYRQFSVPQIDYPLGCNSKTGSHVYFPLRVAMVLLLWLQIILLWHQVTMVALEQHLFQTIVQFDKTIVLHRNLATGSIYDYLFCYCPVVGILFEVLQIWWSTILGNEWTSMDCFAPCCSYSVNVNQWLL